MGAEPYSYEVEYEEDLEILFRKLQQTVFESKDYRCNIENPSSIQEVLMNADKSGTASILDIFGLSESHQIGHLSPLTEKEKTDYFGTLKPSIDQVKKSNLFWDSIGRVEARYLTVYEGETPANIFVAGYSAD